MHATDLVSSALEVWLVKVTPRVAMQNSRHWSMYENDDFDWRLTYLLQMLWLASPHMLVIKKWFTANAENKSKIHFRLTCLYKGVNFGERKRLRHRPVGLARSALAHDAGHHRRVWHHQSVLQRHINELSSG